MSIYDTSQISGRIFNGQMAETQLANIILDHLPDIDFQDFHFDGYDSSFILLEATSNAVFPEHLLEILWELGFVGCGIRYKDSKPELRYFRPSNWKSKNAGLGKS